jgi:hypothetical protein
MKPTTASDDNGAFSAQKSIFEFALRARKITILGALATQFYARVFLSAAAQIGYARIALALLLRVIFSKITRAGFIKNTTQDWG